MENYDDRHDEDWDRDSNINPNDLNKNGINDIHEAHIEHSKIQRANKGYVRDSVGVFIPGQTELNLLISKILEIVAVLEAIGLVKQATTLKNEVRALKSEGLTKQEKIVAYDRLMKSTEKLMNEKGDIDSLKKGFEELSPFLSKYNNNKFKIAIMGLKDCSTELKQAFIKSVDIVSLSSKEVFIDIIDKNRFQDSEMIKGMILANYDPINKSSFIKEIDASLLSDTDKKNLTFILKKAIESQTRIPTYPFNKRDTDEVNRFCACLNMQGVPWSIYKTAKTIRVVCDVRYMNDINKAEKLFNNRDKYICESMDEFIKTVTINENHPDKRDMTLSSDCINDIGLIKNKADRTHIYFAQDPDGNIHLYGTPEKLQRIVADCEIRDAFIRDNSGKTLSRYDETIRNEFIEWIGGNKRYYSGNKIFKTMDALEGKINRQSEISFGGHTYKTSELIADYYKHLCNVSGGEATKEIFDQVVKTHKITHETGAYDKLLGAINKIRVAGINHEPPGFKKVKARPAKMAEISY